jgi:ABC-2 type transport system permease protein/oleandomycin transport system permease protein
MTTADIAQAAVPVDQAAVTTDRLAVTNAIFDTLAIAQRNLIGLIRVPTTVVFSTVQPIIFVLMFRYVFGGSIHVAGYPHYVDFLMPGIFVQTVTFGAMNTGIGLATDLQTGLIERFRSLPMARSAVLAGRALADVVRNFAVVVLMVAMGYLVGFRVHTNIVEFLAAIVLMLLFGLAISWVVALIGLSTGNAEAAQAAMFPLMAVLVFASSAFVNPATMPGPLRAYARHQPVTATINAVRALTHGGPTADRVVVALAWAAGITIVFAILSTRRYRRVA